jgi:hypothetical protein
MESYKPVSNELREELEIAAALKRDCSIKFRSDNDAVVSVKTQILGLYKDEDKEYLKTGSGLQIRLDRLVELNGKPAENYC